MPPHTHTHAHEHTHAHTRSHTRNHTPTMGGVPSMHGVPSMVCGVLFVVPKPKVWHADWCLYWPILRLLTWLDSVRVFRDDAAPHGGDPE